MMIIAVDFAMAVAFSDHLDRMQQITNGMVVVNIMKRIRLTLIVLICLATCFASRAGILDYEDGMKLTVKHQYISYESTSSVPQKVFINGVRGKRFGNEYRVWIKLAPGTNQVVVTTERGDKAVLLDCKTVQYYPDMRVDAPFEDFDKDGVINEMDKFPYDPERSVDQDWDGIGEEWTGRYKSEELVERLNSLGVDFSWSHYCHDDAISLNLRGISISNLEVISSMPIMSLNLCNCSNITDFSALKTLPLENLDLSHTLISSLFPIEGKALTDLQLEGCSNLVDISCLNLVPLNTLDISQTKVSDISPLQHLPLTSLDISGTAVSKLSALKGMPLEKLNIAQTKVSDLSPLRGLPLTSLDISRTPVANLSPLKGMKLSWLNIEGSSVRDLRPLGGVKLKQIGLDVNKMYQGIDVLRESKDLKSINGREAAAFWKEGWDKAEGERQVDVLRENIEKHGMDSTRITFYHHMSEGPKLIIDAIPVDDLSPIKGIPLSSLELRQTNVKDLSPLKGMPLTELTIDECPVRNLSPLKGMPLVHLSASNTKVHDLSPLKGMPLKELNIAGTEVSNLAPLKGMPLTTLDIQTNHIDDLSPLQGMSLFRLELRQTQVTDLSPLKGMPLRELAIDGCPVDDLLPLEEMPLVWLSASNTKIQDLSPLREMPLQGLSIANTLVSDPSPLRAMKLRTLDIQNTRITDISPLADMPLRDLKCDFANITSAMAVIREIKTLLTVTDVEAQKMLDERNGLGGTLMPEDEMKARVRSLDASAHVSPATWASLPKGTYRVDLHNRDVKDISHLAGMPISDLSIRGTSVTNLAPVRKMPLMRLSISCSAVEDISPLQGLQLEYLSAEDLNITNISALAGMPIERLKLTRSAVIDITPLKDMPLRDFMFTPARIERGMNVIREMKTLGTINGLPPREFWEKYDAGYFADGRQ